MECIECGTQNAERNAYCGQCGAFLGKDLRREIDAVVKNQFRDQKVVEIETASAVTTHLVGWAKLFAFIVAVPITMALAVLGFLGIIVYRQQFAELSTAATTLQAQNDELITQLNSALAQVDATKKDLAALQAQQQELSESLATSQALQQVLTANIVKTQDILQTVDIDSLIERMQKLSQDVAAVEDDLDTEPPTDAE
jgi:outer membrane murein-binding lipoprotein Lpp